MDKLKADAGPLAEGFDGSTVRPGPNHSTIEIWYDTEDQARAAHKVIRDLIDASGVTVDARTCTCHPDDNPPKPCPRKFALSECRAAAGVTEAQRQQGEKR